VFLTSGVLVQLLVAKLLVSTFLGRSDTKFAGSKPDHKIIQQTLEVKTQLYYIYIYTHTHTHTYIYIYIYIYIKNNIVVF